MGPLASFPREERGSGTQGSLVKLEISGLLPLTDFSALW